MQIAKHKVVTIDYKLTDGSGNVIESSQGGDAFSYVHGMGATIPALETAMEGKSPGDTLTVSLSPEHAYGERNESLVQVVPRERFETDNDLTVGMRFQTSAEEEPRVVTVMKIDHDGITVDGNHPLAGATLNFAIAIVEVRDATDDEINHGHVHDPETHDH